MISITVLLCGCPPAVCWLPVHVSPQEGTKTTTTLGHRLVATQSGMILSQNKPWGMPLAAPRFPSHVCRSGTTVKCTENWDSIEVIKRWLIKQLFSRLFTHCLVYWLRQWYWWKRYKRRKVDQSYQPALLFASHQQILPRPGCVHSPAEHITSLN